jgi:ABC-type dipeptide/oligopeptide/nickel transport system permease component
MDYRVNTAANLKTPVFWLGAAMVVAGSVTLIYLALLCIQIIRNPSEVELIKWLLAGTGKGGLIASGHLDNKTFEINFSDTLQHMVLGVIGLIMVSILASIINTLIAGGIKLIQFGQHGTSTPTKDSSSSTIERG